jgi:hypothetical protein
MPMLRRLKPLLPLLILSATSGCVTGSTAVVGDYCRIAKPIGYDSKKDTAETVAEIEQHNSKWVCVCENDCPQKPDATQPTP